MKTELSIKTTFNLIFGSIVLLLIGLGIAVIFLFQSLKSLNDGLQNRYDSRQLAGELRQSSDDLTKFARMYVVTGDEKYEQYYWDVLAIRNGTMPLPKEYDRIYWDFLAVNGQKPRPDVPAISLQDLMKQAGFTTEEFAKLTEAQNNSDAMVHTEDVAFHAMKGQFDDSKGGFTIIGTPDQALAIRLMFDNVYMAEKAKIMKPIDEFYQLLDARTLKTTQEASARTFFLLYLNFIFLIVILILTGISFLIIRRNITNPLNLISKVAEQIGAGDLTVILPEAQRRDEIGALNSAFRQMVTTLKRSTSDLSEAVGQLGASASEILAATSQVAAGIADSSTSIAETTTTVEEVRQAAQLSSQKAQSVSDSAQRVAQVSRSGQEAVEDTAAGMDRIREQMETIAQTVVRLSEQSQSIGGIIASVTDLADQSNLLAVNAAIEAAKAGEQGRGFAVVAQEIKSLAEQSKLATAQVRGILSEVQKATSNAVMATEQGSKAVEAGVKQAAQAGDAIRVLAETSSEAVQSAIQIVASSQQQVVGMDQIGVAMESINQAGAQNASSMRQMEVAAQNLHELGEKLKELVAQFKV